MGLHDTIPALLLDALQKTGIAYTIVKGALYYNDVEGYKRSQFIIKKLEKQLPQQGYNKYGNRKVKLMLELIVEITGLPVLTAVTFDSEDEAEYYFYLKDLQDDGIVTKIDLHPRLELTPAFYIGQTKFQATVYIPDFYVEYANGRREYVDVKGMSTEAGDLRRKLYLYCSTLKSRPYYEIPLRWVASNFKHAAPGSDGWIDWDELQKKLAVQRKAKKSQAQKSA